MIKINNLTKSFDDKIILNNISVEFTKGLNFIIGPSGSGKTTLLKILSGIDKKYNGQVFFKDKALKNLTTSDLNSYYYNSVGFIWQNFNLIDHLTVRENIEVVLNLGGDSNIEMQSKIDMMLNQLAIAKIADQKVATLSGGQKQRVAIARVLVKNPDIIIADEPSGALDKGSTKIIINTLKKIAEDKIVIVVTHDKGIISESANIYELYKGTLIKKNENLQKENTILKKNYITPNLTFKKAFNYGFKNFKGLLLKNMLTALVITLSAFFLLLNFSGNIVNQQQDILDKLINEKGNNLRNINLASSAISSGNFNEDGTNNSSVDVEQDLSKVLYKYIDDPRIELFIPSESINNMVIQLPGVKGNYNVETSNTVPYVNEIVAGQLPKMNGREIAISSLLVKNLSLKPEDVIGKTIDISGSNFDWSSGQPIEKPVVLKNLTIVGVIDTEFKTKLPNGKDYSYELEDGIVLSIEMIKELRKQLGTESDNISFTLRVKNVKDIMAIVDELSKEGITAFGEFESVKDILKISNISEDGTKSMTTIIALIGILATTIITIINYYLRKYEFSVLKINGYSKMSILKLNLMEGILLSIASTIILLITFIPINSLSLKLFSVQISGIESLALGILIIIIISIITSFIGFLISSNIRVSKNLMTGDR